MAELELVDVLRPGVGRRYSGLPVDHVDVTGFHTDYTGSPMRPQLLDLRVGDQVFWYEDGARLQARIDEVVLEGPMLRVAFTDVTDGPPEW